MRVSAKLWAGFLATLLLGAVLIYQLSVIRGLADANRRLASISSRVAVVGTEQLYRLDQMAENAAKYRITRDARYAEQFVLLFERVRGHFDDIDTLNLASTEREHVDRVSRLVLRLEPVARALRETAGGADPAPEAPGVAARAGDWIGDLRLETLALTEASRAAILEAARTSTREARQAERRAWIVALLVLAFGALTTLIALRSVSRGLQHLSAGTRKVAEGDLDYRLSGAREKEFRELQSAFNVMVERLSELDRMKKDFIAGISHDLKSPLASMRETLSVLLDEVPGPLAERQERMLRLASQSGERLAGMISNLLDLARLEAGVIEYRVGRHDLAGLVRGVVDEMETRFEEKGVRAELKLPDALPVECDAGWMSQVVQNLVDNALAVAPEGSAIAIELSEDGGGEEHGTGPGPGPGRVRLAVRDRGPGIPEELADRIFERFMRGNGRYSGGVGLGLTISREIVRAHRGDIWVESRPAGGSSFVVEVPATREAPVRGGVTAQGTGPAAHGGPA